MSSKKLIIIVSSLFIVFFLRFLTFYQTIPRYVDGQEIFLQVVLQEEPDISTRGQRFVIKNDLNQRIYILSSLNALYHYGDRLAIKGKLQVNKNDAGVTFLNLNFPQISILPSSQNLFSQASFFVRQKSLKLFQETLPQTSASLLSGIVFGAKEDFPDDFFNSLKITGVLHVIAASGMNVSFFTGAVMFSLGAILKRQLALFLSIFAVIFYSFLVGFEPSILRASIMATIALAASFFGRQNLAIVTLFATGLLMLLWQPAYLFDVGFQLSFMATMGILLIKPVLDSIGGREGVDPPASLGEALRAGGLEQDFKTTLSAQLATFPILLGTFGSIGILSLLVNVLVLWTVPILMLLGSLAVLVGLAVPVIGELLLFLSLPFLFFFEQVISLFGSLGWNLEVENWPWELTVGYYLVIISVIVARRGGERRGAPGERPQRSEDVGREREPTGPPPKLKL